MIMYAIYRQGTKMLLATDGVVTAESNCYSEAGNWPAPLLFANLAQANAYIYGAEECANQKLEAREYAGPEPVERSEREASL